MARTFILLAALVALSATATATNPPGLRVAITDPGLTELKNVALPIINAALQDVTLPNMNLQEHVPVLGHISLDLSNMKVTGFRLPNAVLAVSSPPQFTMDMSGLTLQVSLNYAWRKVHWPHISDHGSVTATPQGGSVDLTMSIGSSGGHVVLDTTNAAVSFSSFKIHFSGKVSWLYNLLVGLFKGSIKKAVQSAVQKQLQNAVDTSLNKALAKIKLTDTLGGGKSRVNVNVGVVDITAGSDYLSLGDMLAISNNMTGAACPIVPHTLPSLAPGAAGSMLQLLLDDSFLNCVSWSATSNGALTTTLTDASLPKAFPLRLNTSDWGRLIPELQAKYPNRPMQLLLSPQAAPSITSSASGVTGEMAFALNFSVVTTAGTPTPVFAFASSLALGLNVQVKPAATNPVLVLNITELELDLTLTGSQVGTINLAPIQSLFHTFLPLLKDILNGFLSKGFPLPSTDGLQLVGPSVEFDAGFLAIATNFTFATAEAADAATPAFVKPTPLVDPMAAQLDALRLGELVQHLRGSKQM